MEKFERAINGTIERLHEQFGIVIECWVNNIYEVWVYRKKNADSLVHNPIYKGKCTYITIKRKDKKINAIGFTKHGRKILENQEHIFVEGLVDCQKTIYNELSTEAKLEIWKSKHNRKGGI